MYIYITYRIYIHTHTLHIFYYTIHTHTNSITRGLERLNAVRSTHILSVGCRELLATTLGLFIHHLWPFLAEGRLVAELVLRLPRSARRMQV